MGSGTVGENTNSGVNNPGRTTYHKVLLWEMSIIKTQTVHELRNLD
jgi:hypothetical protein